MLTPMDANGPFIVLSPSLRSGQSPRAGHGHSASTSNVSRPYLPRLNTREQDPPHRPRKPLLNLRFSSRTFLGSVVHDTHSQHPLYTLSTIGPSTAIERRTCSRDLNRIADIRWPKSRRAEPGWDGVVVRMLGGQWETSESILKPASLTGSRKFSIPDFPHSLKWKVVGRSFHCTTSLVNDPVAIFELSGPTPQLKIFVTIRDKSSPRDPSTLHNGVSVILLDFLLVTALLLVTDPLEWTKVALPVKEYFINTPVTPQQAHESVNGQATHPNGSSLSIAESLAPSEASFGVNSLSGSSSGSLSTPERPDMGAPDSPALSETSQIAMWEEISSIAPWDLVSVLPPSPATDSPYHPSPSSTIPPSHNHFDPTFYDRDIPGKFRSSVKTLPLSRSASGSSSRRRRELPFTPATPVHPPFPSSRTSTIPASAQPSGERTNTFLSPPTEPFAHRMLFRSNSVCSLGGPRRLPTPPFKEPPPELPRTDSPTISISPDSSRILFSVPRLLPDPPGLASSSAASHTIGRSRGSLQKEAEEVGDWVQSLTRLSTKDNIFDTPPPAYNSIRFTMSSQTGTPTH